MWIHRKNSFQHLDSQEKWEQASPLPLVLPSLPRLTLRRRGACSDFVLLEIEESIKNYPVCLPERETWFEDRIILKYSRYGRVFNMKTCNIQDSFLKVGKSCKNLKVGSEFMIFHSFWELYAS